VLGGGAVLDLIRNSANHQLTRTQAVGNGAYRLLRAVSSGGTRCASADTGAVNYDGAQRFYAYGDTQASNAFG
jgi:hypothetical protein